MSQICFLNLNQPLKFNEDTSLYRTLFRSPRCLSTLEGLHCKSNNFAASVVFIVHCTTGTLMQVVSFCRYFAGLIIGCLQGVSKEELLSSHYCPEPGYWDKHPLVSMMHLYMQLLPES